MSLFTAFLDTCVLVPVAGADLLLRLAEASTYRPLWSEKVLEELAGVLVELHPDKKSGVTKRVDAMRKFFPDATVGCWEDLVSSLKLPDENDRHVLAAAIRGRADIIVTNNKKDFPKAVVHGDFGIEVTGLDDFLLDQLDLFPDLVINILATQAADTGNPPMSQLQLLEALSRSGAPKFTQEAKAQLWRI